MYKIELKKEAKKALKLISAENKTRILFSIDQLQENPFPIGFKKLKGIAKELFRIRCGKYRIIYQVENSLILILIVRISLRKDVYRNLNLS